MESVFVNEVIESAQSYAAERIPLSRIQMVQALDPSLRPVKANRSLLRYVFFSMIVNAVDHLKGVGVVTMVTGENTDGAIEVTVSTVGSNCPERHAHPVDGSTLPGSLKQRGTGLPLPVVRDIIEGQGGTLSWENYGDGEAKFTALMPGTRAAAVGTHS